mgnify:FL=1
MKKYKCKVVETYTKVIEIPEDIDINDIDMCEVYDFSMPCDSEETVTELKDDTIPDLVYVDGGFETVVQERFSKAIEDKPIANPDTVVKGTKLEDLF